MQKKVKLIYNLKINLVYQKIKIKVTYNLEREGVYACLFFSTERVCLLVLYEKKKLHDNGPPERTPTCKPTLSARHADHAWAVNPPSK